MIAAMAVLALVAGVGFVVSTNTVVGPTRVIDVAPTLAVALGDG